jgi:hypothetical protein
MTSRLLPSTRLKNIKRGSSAWHQPSLMASEDYFQSTVGILCEIFPPKIHSLMELFRMSI